VLIATGNLRLSKTDHRASMARVRADRPRGRKQFLIKAQPSLRLRTLFVQAAHVGRPIHNGTTRKLSLANAGSASLQSSDPDTRPTLPGPVITFASFLLVHAGEKVRTASAVATRRIGGALRSSSAVISQRDDASACAAPYGPTAAIGLGGRREELGLGRCPRDWGPSCSREVIS
jgi:hypothetical protein